MDDRMRPRLRVLVDTTLELIAAQEISLDVATRKLHDAGVPFSVICRVLAPETITGQAPQASATDGRPQMA